MILVSHTIKYSQTLIHSRPGTIFRHSLIDVRLNRQCQFSSCVPAGKELRLVALKQTLRQALFAGRQQKICHLHLPPQWPYRKLVSNAMLLCAAINNSCMRKKCFTVTLFFNVTIAAVCCPRATARASNVCADEILPILCVC